MYIGLAKPLRIRVKLIAVQEAGIQHSICARPLNDVYNQVNHKDSHDGDHQDNLVIIPQILHAGSKSQALNLLPFFLPLPDVILLPQLFLLLLFFLRHILPSLRLLIFTAPENAGQKHYNKVAWFSPDHFVLSIISE